MTSPLRYLLDPSAWVREILHSEPWERQVAILESIRDCKITAVRSSHATGKSFAAAAAILWFLNVHPQSICISTAPTQRQVEHILWREIRSLHAKGKLPGECLQTELKIAPDWYALGFTAPERAGGRFQGFHSASGYVLVVVDEASGVSEDVFEEIDGILTSDQSRLLLIGNPLSCAGRFYSEFSGSDAMKITVGAYDSPNLTKYGITEADIIAGAWKEKITGPLPAPFLVTPGWVADRVKRWGISSPMYQSRVLAQFPTASADTLITLTSIEAAVTRQLPQSEPVQLAVDVARFGSDSTVIMLRRGPAATIYKVLSGVDTMTTTGEIVRAMMETRAEVCKIDSVGIGSGCYDRAVELNVNALEMQAGGRASDPSRYANARAEWWWHLRELFEQGKISIPDDEDLISELSGIRYKVDSKGRILIESKDSMRARGMSSPDRADALAMAFSDGIGGGLAGYNEWDFSVDHRGEWPEDRKRAEDIPIGLFGLERRY